MALEKEYKLNDTPHGVAYPNAYIRIVAAEFNAKNQLTLTLDFWASAAVYNAQQSFRPWKTERIVMEYFDQETPMNIKTALYTWLKTQQQFVSAKDA